MEIREEAIRALGKVANAGADLKWLVLKSVEDVLLHDMSILLAPLLLNSILDGFVFTHIGVEMFMGPAGIAVAFFCGGTALRMRQKAVSGISYYK